MCGPRAWRLPTWWPQRRAREEKEATFGELRQLGLAQHEQHSKSAVAFPARRFLTDEVIDANSVHRYSVVSRQACPSGPEHGWQGPPVWLHGDLHPANVVVSDGTLSGVIDFGELCAGDPATDLAAASTAGIMAAPAMRNAHGRPSGRSATRPATCRPAWRPYSAPAPTSSSAPSLPAHHPVAGTLAIPTNGRDFRCGLEL